MRVPVARFVAWFVAWFVLLALGPAAARAGVIPLHRALSDGQVTVEAQARSYSSAVLTVRSRSSAPLTIDVIGSFLEPLTRRGSDSVDPGVQPLALGFSEAGDREVVLAPGKTWSQPLRTFCMKRGAASPGERTPLRLAREPVPPLISRLLTHWHAHQKIDQSAVQEAVWQVMGLPEALRGTPAGAQQALDKLSAAHKRLLRHLMANLDMAVTPKGELFFGQGSLDDLRSLGVDVPELGDSLLVALPSREQTTKLARLVTTTGDTLRPRRYFSAAGEVYASAAGGLYRYLGAKQAWVRETTLEDVTRVVGRAGGPVFLLTQAGALRVKPRVEKGDWQVLDGTFADVVFTPWGLFALDRQQRCFQQLVDLRQARWQPAMSASALDRFHATAGRLYRHSRGGALHVWTGKRWRRRVSDGVERCWAGATHLWYVTTDGKLWLDWDAARAARVVEPRIGEYYVACVRPGVDHLYVKTRAHLVIVYDPKHDQ